MLVDDETTLERDFYLMLPFFESFSVDGRPVVAKRCVHQSKVTDEYE